MKFMLSFTITPDKAKRDEAIQRFLKTGGQPPKGVKLLGVCPSNPSSRGEGDAGRCEAAGSKKPEAYSLEYVEDFLGPRTTQMPADRLPQ